MNYNTEYVFLLYIYSLTYSLQHSGTQYTIKLQSSGIVLYKTINYNTYSPKILQNIFNYYFLMGYDTK